MQAFILNPYTGNSEKYFVVVISKPKNHYYYKYNGFYFIKIKSKTII